MREVKQLGVNNVLMGGPKMPWQESDLRAIVDKLKSRGLIVGQTSESGSKAITLSPDGQAQLDSLNAELRRLFDERPEKFSQGLAGRDKSFFAIAKNMKFLLRMVAPPATETA